MVLVTGVRVHLRSCIAEYLRDKQIPFLCVEREDFGITDRSNEYPYKILRPKNSS